MCIRDSPITGEKFNYTSKMPKGWRPVDNAWARYFNDNIIQANGGIDPYSIELLDGRSIAEAYGTNKGIREHKAEPDYVKAKNLIIETILKNKETRQKLARGEKIVGSDLTRVDNNIDTKVKRVYPKGVWQHELTNVQYNKLITPKDAKRRDLELSIENMKDWILSLIHI